MQFRITGIDLDAMHLVVSCPRCKAQPGQACDFKASRSWDQHKARGDNYAG